MLVELFIPCVTASPLQDMIYDTQPIAVSAKGLLHTARSMHEG